MDEYRAEAIQTCTSGDLEKLETLWRNPIINKEEQTLLWHKLLQAACKSGQTNPAAFLLARHPYDHGLTIDRDTGFAAAAGGFVEIYEMLYQADSNVVHLSFGHTGDPITVAVQTNNVPVLNFLLCHGADPNAGRYLSKLSPIALAATCSSEEVISLLVKNGAQVSGSNALQSAITAGRLDLLACLLSNGADAKDRPDYNHRPKLFDHLESPLHTAVRTGDLDAVKILLDHGADPSIVDEHGKSVMNMAEAKGRKGIVTALQSSKR